MSPTPHSRLIDRTSVVGPVGLSEPAGGPVDGFDRADAYVACLDPALTIQLVNREFDRRFGERRPLSAASTSAVRSHPSVRQPLMVHFSRMLEASGIGSPRRSSRAAGRTPPPCCH
ncbi:hypothetical protein GCM10010233_61500 [Streptomyces pseudogriseolus]|nr:hypothetical protein GCM10010233_61500 [Streptomyces gancidicus]